MTFPHPSPARLLLALIAVAGPPAPAQSPKGGGDRIEVVRQDALLLLGWRDAEDVLQGTLLPAPLAPGRPLTLSLRVGPLQGAAFEGPIHLALRAEADGMTQQVTATREDGRWLAELLPTVPGPHTLTIRFQTTRNKVLLAELPVDPPALPRIPPWLLAVLLVVGVVGAAALRLYRAPGAG